MTEVFTYVAWIKPTENAGRRAILLQGFPALAAAASRVESYLNATGIKPSTAGIELQSKPIVMRGELSRTRSLFDDAKACVARVTDAQGNHLVTIVLEDFQSGQGALVAIHEHLREFHHADPATVQVELLDPTVLTHTGS